MANKDKELYLYDSLEKAKENWIHQLGANLQLWLEGSGFEFDQTDCTCDYLGFEVYNFADEGFEKYFTIQLNERNSGFDHAYDLVCESDIVGLSKMIADELEFEYVDGSDELAKYIVQMIIECEENHKSCREEEAESLESDEIILALDGTRLKRLKGMTYVVVD